MTEQINKSKLSFLQLIIPVLLAFMVFLLGIIAWYGQSNHAEAKNERLIQQNINLQVLENLGTLNSDCRSNSGSVDGLLENDRRQDLMLQDHETKLNLLKH